MINLKYFLPIIATVVFNTACNSQYDQTQSKLKVATDTAVVKYQCPMKCQNDTAYTSPGNCPVCEMELERIK